MIGKYISEKNIGKISLINMVAVILVLTVTMLLFIANQTNNEFEAERAQLVKNFISSKKTILMNEVDRLFDYVEFNTSGVRDSLKSSSVTQVDEAVSSAAKIVALMQAKGLASESANAAAEYLKKYTWDEGKGSLYVIDKTGKVIIHPEYPAGTNLYNLSTPYGSSPVKDEISVAFSRNGGFIDNSMPESKDSDKFVNRTAYVRKLGYFDWYIGTSFTDEDVKDIVKDQIVKRVDTVIFDDSGHYFILSLSGKAVAVPGNSSQVGTSVLGIRDNSGVTYYKDLISHSLQDNSYFSFYNMSYADWSKEVQVVSHCRIMEQWGWLLCATVPMNDLTPIINERNAALKEKLNKNKKYSLIIFAISALVAAAISWYFSSHVQRLFNRYRQDIENRNRDLEELNIEFTNQLYTDHLTGLPNRNKLVNDLNMVTNPILILLNIDSFKKINETYGFIIGDFVLIDVGERISSFVCDPEPKCYKFHGNEYAMLIDCSMSKEALTVLMQRLSEHLEFTVKCEELEIEIDISITCGVSAEKGNVFEKAGMAMRLAEKKKQPYMIYDSSIDMVDEYEKDIRWTKVVKRALSDNNLVPFFQPIANSKTGTVEKFECLVRIIENGEVITPFQFLGIIKKTKLYQHVTRRMMSKSFEIFAENDFSFTINLSIEDIMDESTSRFILDMLKTSGIANRVIFELLESEGIESFSVINDFIKEIKKTGAMVAIDDFGSGYSNFVYLSELNVDIIKIDGSLIKNIDHDRQSQIIVETIIKFANQLNIKTVAEFVHSEDVRRKVIDMGIDYIQGYHVGKPVADISDYMN